MPNAVIVSTARTPIGKAFRGALNNAHGAEMGGHVIAAAVARARLDPAEVEDVLIGCATPEGATGSNIARQAAIRAGLPVSTPGFTLDRKCSSGLQTIALAAQRIMAGEGKIFVAGGLESVSLTQPHMNLFRKLDDGVQAVKPELYWSMIQTADHVARRYAISREAQDDYALESQHRTAAAQEAGRFDAEIVPITVSKSLTDKSGAATGEDVVTLGRDEGNRPDTTREGLAKLKPVQGEDAFITAGNASQLSDGASVCVVMAEDEAERTDSNPWGVSPASPSWDASRRRWGSVRSSPCRSCWGGTVSAWTTSICGN